MKFVRIILITISILIVLAIAALIGVYKYYDIEKKTLTNTDRQHTSSKYITLSGGITHYELAGPDTGHVVILIHGFSVPYYIWDGTFEHLVGQGFRVLRYDQFGRGLSDRPNVEYNQALYMQQLKELIEKLHLKGPVSLAGVSFGGKIAADFASNYPKLTDKLILVDPAYVNNNPAVPQVVLDYQEAMHPDKRVNGQLEDFKYPKQHPNWIKLYKPQMQYKGFRNALLSTIYNYPVNGKSTYSNLNKQHKPVLLIWGKADQTVPFKYSDSVRNVLKADFISVADAGHLSHLEQPDFVNYAMADFLSDGIKPHEVVKIGPYSDEKFTELILAPYNQDNDNCVQLYQYPLRIRLNKYPFSKANKIVAVSYRALLPEPSQTVRITYKNGKQILSKPPASNHDNGLIITNGALDKSSSLLEYKALSRTEISLLTNIIFNTTYAKPLIETSGSGNCFEPRNALLFYDKQGKILDYMEICFGCAYYESQSGKISLGTNCNQKFDLVKSFFKNIGINYVEKRRDDD